MTDDKKAGAVWGGLNMRDGHGSQMFPCNECGCIEYPTCSYKDDSCDECIDGATGNHKKLDASGHGIADSREGDEECPICASWYDPDDADDEDPDSCPLHGAKKVDEVVDLTCDEGDAHGRLPDSAADVTIREAPKPQVHRRLVDWHRRASAHRVNEYPGVPLPFLFDHAYLDGSFD